MRTLIVLLVLAAALVASRARADANVVRLEYDVPPECPRSDAFTGELVRRAPHTRIAPPGERARVLDVQVAPRGHAMAGRLVVREIDGTQTTRAVSGATCAEVVSALALIAAVAVDPTAALASANGANGAMDTPASTSAASGTSAASASVVIPAPTASARDTRDTRDARDARDAGASPRANDSPTGPPGWHFAIGAHAGFVSGVSPDTLVTVPVFFEAAHASGGVFEPTIRARFQRTGSGVVSANGASGDFTWTAGSIDLCPVALPPGAVRVVPCARVEAGALAATGVDVTPAKSSTRPWFSAGPVVRGRWAVTAQLFVELEGSLAFPTVRDRFTEQPQTTLFRAPGLGYAASAGVGLSIW